MECPGGGGSTAALPPGGGGGGGNSGGNGGHQQQWGATQFYGGELQPQQNQQQQNQLHQQLMQQQQLMQLAAAAAASGQAGHQQLIPAASQAPTLNMMLQGMQAGHHTMPSPSNSAGFLLLQQPAQVHHQQGGRDISPGSTPGLPAPSVTPPTIMDDRNWVQQQQFYAAASNPPPHAHPAHGHRMLNMQEQKSLEEQIEYPPREMLNQMQEIALARSLNQYPYAQSPPTMFHQQMPHHPMPPRPRPEGGQDPSPNFLNEHDTFKTKKDDLLVIDSWTGGPNQASTTQEQDEKFYHRPSEDKPEQISGWGAPPPTNPNGWGQPPPKIGNWQQPPPTAVPQQPPPPQNSLFGGPPPNADRGGRGGFDFNRGRGRGRGDFRGRGDINRGRIMRGGGRGGRGGGPPRATALEREQEKQDGKKNAIAETIAMMNKMKMEDKERKDAHQKYEEERRERNRELGIVEEPPLELPVQDQEIDHHFRGRGRGRSDHSGRFQRGQRGNSRGSRGQRGGQNALVNPMGIPPMFGGQNAASGMLFPPPGVPGFPGMEQLFLGGAPGIPGFHPGAYPQPFFHPLAHGGPPGGQFGNQHFRFPNMGRGMGRGFMHGGRGNLDNRGGRGRGGGQNRGRGGHQIKTENLVQTSVQELPKNEEIEVTETHLEPENEPQNGVEAAEIQIEEQSKNVISGQGKAKGQLALSAAQTDSELNLRDRLTQQLVTGQTECMVCLDKIRPKNATWHCDGECFQVFHIHCIKKWSKTARTENGGWRCPGCQYVRLIFPREYRCFCGKVVDPVYERREIPHSCGEVCGKELKTAEGNVCVHKCVELCHPGPCPPCVANIMQTCPCGKTSRNGRCGTKPICDLPCGKLLNCGVHFCPSKCHSGACQPCSVQIIQKCYCSSPSQQIVDCTSAEIPEFFSCEKICEKILPCEIHKCSQICHPEKDCEICPLSPELIKSCHCGKTLLEPKSRISCTDPIPTCGKICGKKLMCGPVGNNHTCQELCHPGECSKCPSTTKVRCRCGLMDKEMDCDKLNSRADDARCEKQCKKQRDCLRHKCGQKCCILIDHPCPLTCGRLLSCGLHRCSDPCHRGNCGKCPNVSFDELSCFCGQNVIYPPINCGVKPPHCDNICTRNHNCDHLVFHNCHSDLNCPPCTALTEKWCHGKHELRKSVACHIEAISCGKSCEKALNCGRHFCIKTCHPGECDQDCSQACPEPRLLCGHPCNAPCHEPPCNNNTPCMEKLKLNCSCGHLTSMVTCSNIGGMHSGLLAAQIRDLNNGISTNILVNNKKIECNEECAKMERNRRLALALQIENPDMSAKLSAPKYSEFLKEMAKKDAFFASNVHEKLTDLVKLAKDSKQKSRSYSFEYMNRDKRQFVHELSDHFGVESESYDAEPKRNVVVTALKERVWLPSQSIIEVVLGVRKAPVATSINTAPSQPTFTTLQPITKSSLNDKNAAVVDYFDYED